MFQANAHSLYARLGVSPSLTCSDSKRSMPIGYTPGTKWCKRVVMVTWHTQWRCRMLYVPNTKAGTRTRSKELRAWLGLLKVCTTRAVPRLGAWGWRPECGCNWLAVHWPGKWWGWDWASGDTKADLHVSWQRPKNRQLWAPLSCLWAAFCWAWLNINKRGITKVWRHLLGPSPVERLVGLDFFQLPLLPFLFSFRHAHHVQQKEKSCSGFLPVFHCSNFPHYSM